MDMDMDRDRDRVKLLSNRIERSKLKPGDHIYTWRITYTHHAGTEYIQGIHFGYISELTGIYIGNNRVIHFTTPEDGARTQFWSSFRPAFAGCKACADAKCQHQAPANDGSVVEERRVLISCLDCFLHNRGHLYLYAYGVTTMFFMGKAPGTCTMAASDPPDKVLHRAFYLLKHGYGKYSLIKHNCEDFSIYCKTELVIQSYNSVGLSNQVHGWISGATRVTILGTELARYKADFGVRKDVTRVPVEMLVKN